MKVSIIGYGFVGEALHKVFKKNVETQIIDPKLNTEIKDIKLYKPDIIFICVPTPMNDDGTQDTFIISNVINDLKKLSIKSLVVIKSTIIPDYAESIFNSELKIVYNPEFLREAHAYEDFINSSLIVFGGLENHCRVAENFYKLYTKCKSNDFVYTDIVAASLIKYSINSFLATKVTFFNQLNEIFNQSGTTENWDNFIKFLQKDNRIGCSHMHVPGHDGRKGFGGACLPKDSSAFYEYSKNLQKPITLVQKAITINNDIRKKYTTKLDREKLHNINYQDKND